MKKILLVEDDEIIVKGLKYLLNKNYFVDVSYNIKSAKEMLKNKYDLLILDLSLPDGKGFEIAKLNLNIPIIFLTADNLEDNIVTGLNMADDYILKPFRNQELLIRIEKVLGRYQKDTLSFKNLFIDFLKYEVYLNDVLIDVTALEFNIIKLLFENNNKVVTRDKIISLIWDDNNKFVNDNTLSVYIKRIRQKLDNKYIKTVKGIGYMVCDEI